MTYPIKFRKHVLAIRAKDKLTFEEAAIRFGVGVASLVRWAKRLEPDQSKPRKRKIDLDKLIEDVEKYPDSYQYERAERFGVTQRAIWQALQKINVTYKKSPETPQGRRRQADTIPTDNSVL